ncbi:serine hydrolase domain-containing protein [Flagellimonas zhangzhouensis]|uniref:CubicO group peptidase, beta-lactamase class C family n=1 Tax=Flagellimonas zhangzhouensis TaxID=1073328 RepID=A0A1H2YPX6_9FLAO|nr:serine hydrolase [Allomuricauda zhangzhouensis]SDR01311.1 CubicO group peptidase, beta-lactamase class C family [Allomuricauda zhangzhouensis]SDX06569.1 CubicO group peptidase, beta-lactamase class C family [Allomuricauda zhangzhouensis]
MKSTFQPLQKLCFAIVCLFAIQLCAQTFPDRIWHRASDAEVQPWQNEKSKAFREYLIDSTKITGLMIVHKGKVVFDYGDVEELSYIASIRKSVLSMMYGQYVEDGTIKLDKTIKELGIDDVEGILPIEQKATVQDIISARSGVYHPEGYPGGMQEYAPKRGSVEPGSYWLYSNWDFNVAGYIFEQETGKNIYDEVERQLANPLHMQDWDRSLQQKQGNPAISKYLAYPMWFSTRDMARLGLMMLNKGKWKDTQVISESWVNEMLKSRTSHVELNKNVPVFLGTGINYGYGYMWWLWQDVSDKRYEGAYSAKGAMGQNITVYPAIETVLAFKTKAAYRRSNSSDVRLKVAQKAAEIFEMQ